MSLTMSQANALVAALQALAQGLPRRFEDLLWLHFGDEWTDYRKFLASKGHVTVGALGTGEGTITDKGRALINRLRNLNAQAEPAVA